MKRYLFNQIKEDLEKKMVFLGGPRQVGKTTISLQLLGAKDESHNGYLNWDSKNDKKEILQGNLPSNQKLVVFDEIHKYKNWRNLVKGLYDKNKSLKQFLITGSAKLDYYRKGGDSLQGRYHYLRLHPLSVGELNLKKADLEDFLELGGFPEPFFSSSKKEWRRWQNERTKRIIKEDVVDLERVLEIGQLELLADAIPTRIGSPLSMKNLSEDIQVSGHTIKRWIDILDNLYHTFRIAPYGAPKIKAVKKEQKIYMWDWSLCEDDGAKFENLVASQLLKYCHYLEDTEGYKMELRYLRDIEGREIDFVVIKDKKPLFAVEAKFSDTEISPSIKYASKRTIIPKYYQVHLGKKDFENKEYKVRVLPFWDFCKEMEMP